VLRILLVVRRLISLYRKRRC